MNHIRMLHYTAIYPLGDELQCEFFADQIS